MKMQSIFAILQTCSVQMEFKVCYNWSAKWLVEVNDYLVENQQFVCNGFRKALDRKLDEAEDETDADDEFEDDDKPKDEFEDTDDEK